MAKFQKKQTFCEAEQFFYSKPCMRDVHYPQEENGTYIGDAYVLRSGDDAPMFLQNTDWIVYDEKGNALFAAKDAEFREVYEPLDNDVTVTVPLRYVVGLVNECDRLEAELGAMLFMTVDTSKRELAIEVERLKAEVRHQKALVEIQVTLRERFKELSNQSVIDLYHNALRYAQWCYSQGNFHCVPLLTFEQWMDSDWSKPQKPNGQVNSEEPI